MVMVPVVVVTPCGDDFLMVVVLGLGLGAETHVCERERVKWLDI